VSGGVDQKAEIVSNDAMSEISEMTVPIKKRINTELFIDGKQGLYIQKGDREMEKYLTSWKG